MSVDAEAKSKKYYQYSTSPSVVLVIIVASTRPEERQQILHAQLHVLDLIAAQRSPRELPLLVLKLHTTPVSHQRG